MQMFPCPGIEADGVKNAAVAERVEPRSHSNLRLFKVLDLRLFKVSFAKLFLQGMRFVLACASKEYDTL